MVGGKLAHYEIVEKIGSGGMGEVYKARDTKLGRDVAIKILPADLATNSESRQRFEREARSVAALKHPNIVTIHSVEEAKGHVFLTMELVEGKTLSQILPNDGLRLNQLFDIAIPVAEAIHSAHKAGITHRDLKPSNLMIDADGRVKILDFGLAKFLAPDTVAADDKTMAVDPDTQEGRVLGTVPYMSPEQADAKPIDHRSDIFSLGIVLYEMATGERPFKGDSSLSIMSSILRDTPSTITDIRGHLPVQLGRIVEHCLAKDPRRRFQSALDIANELEALRTEVSSATGAVAPVGAPSKPFMNKRVGIGAALLFVAVLVFVIFKPFTVEITPDQTAEATGGNTLAIMYFDNLSDPEDTKRHGEIIAELLITGLSESEHVRVVSSQRLYDILKGLGKEGDKSIDRSTATEIATKAEARWMMQGRILQSEPNFVITSQMVEVASGTVAASQKITGRPGETIFALVDRITRETLSDLSVPTDITNEPTTIVELSTDSEEAYRHYLEGIENGRKYFRQEARASFMKATDLDTAFAAAYYHLSRFTDGKEKNRALASAVRHMEHATAREQAHIQIQLAWRDEEFHEIESLSKGILGEYPDDKEAMDALASYYIGIAELELALEIYNRLIDLDPLDKNAYNRMAYLYDRMGDFDQAIWAINKYISLAPNEPNPHDTRGDLYASNGDIEKAIESYRRAVEIKPDFFDYMSVGKLGTMHLFKGDYDEAATHYRRAFASDRVATRARARMALTWIPIYRGEVNEALDQIDAALAADELEGELSQVSEYNRTRAKLLAMVGEDAAALEAVHRAREVDDDASIFSEAIWAWRLAGIGLLDMSQTVLAPLLARRDTLRGLELVGVDIAEGVLKWRRGDIPGALSKIEPHKARTWTMLLYSLGRVYLDADRPQDAIEVLEEIITDFHAEGGDRTPLFYYYLAVAYQKAGRNSDALEQLETFLKIWEHADPRIDELSDGRKRLESLKRGS